MSVIKVKFDRSKYDTGRQVEYSYFCDYAVEVGDRVVVESPYNGYTTVTVTAVGAGLDSIKANKEVVCLVDDSQYKARQAAKARLAELSAELERKANEAVTTKRLRKMLKGDAEAAAMLDEADALSCVLKGDPGGFLEATLKRMGVDVMRVDLN